MKYIILAAAIAFIGPMSGATTASAQAKAERTYDCTKAGNANKTVCKEPAAKAAKRTPKPAAAERNYDCTKAGNANKAACKAVAATVGKPAPTATPAPAAKAATSGRNYDCTKAGNANKTVCKEAAAAAAAQPTARSPSAATGPVAKTGPAIASSAERPVGATAQCKDGTYSKSKTHSGTCSRHHGVANWL